MAVLLVCEGACNIHIGYVDALVTKARRIDGMPLLSDFELSQLHSLRHTPHTMVSPWLATCNACGQQRRYGKDGW